VDIGNIILNSEFPDNAYHCTLSIKIYFSYLRTDAHTQSAERSFERTSLAQHIFVSHNLCLRYNKNEICADRKGIKDFVSNKPPDLSQTSPSRDFSVQQEWSPAHAGTVIVCQVITAWQVHSPQL
jgi:hypothetical protein